MNNPDSLSGLDHSDKLRAIIQKARADAGKTEKQVNAEYFKQMDIRNWHAPKAIMTQVRDRRREFTLSKREANCMAQVLGIEPDLLYPPASPQADLIPEETATVPKKGGKDLESPKGIVLAPKSSVRPPEQTGTERRGGETQRKVSAGFYETPEGLRFLLNMELSTEQFERLTLAIPAYMMQIEERGERLHVRAQVPIFPYQAELVMRAIYGGR